MVTGAILYCVSAVVLPSNGLLACGQCDVCHLMHPPFRDAMVYVASVHQQALPVSWCRCNK